MRTQPLFALLSSLCVLSAGCAESTIDAASGTAAEIRFDPDPSELLWSVSGRVGLGPKDAWHWRDRNAAFLREGGPGLERSMGEVLDAWILGRLSEVDDILEQATAARNCYADQVVTDLREFTLDQLYKVILALVLSGEEKDEESTGSTLVQKLGELGVTVGVGFGKAATKEHGHIAAVRRREAEFFSKRSRVDVDRAVIAALDERGSSRTVHVETRSCVELDASPERLSLFEQLNFMLRQEASLFEAAHSTQGESEVGVLQAIAHEAVQALDASGLTDHFLLGNGAYAPKFYDRLELQCVEITSLHDVFLRVEARYHEGEDRVGYYWIDTWLPSQSIFVVLPAVETLVAAEVTVSSEEGSAILNLEDPAAGSRLYASLLVTARDALCSTCDRDLSSCDLTAASDLLERLEGLADPRHCQAELQRLGQTRESNSRISRRLLPAMNLPVLYRDATEKALVAMQDELALGYCVDRDADVREAVQFSQTWLERDRAFTIVADETDAGIGSAADATRLAVLLGDLTGSFGRLLRPNELHERRLESLQNRIVATLPSLLNPDVRGQLALSELLALETIGVLTQHPDLPRIAERFSSYLVSSLESDLERGIDLDAPGEPEVTIALIASASPLTQFRGPQEELRASGLAVVRAAVPTAPDLPSEAFAWLVRYDRYLQGLPAGSFRSEAAGLCTGHYDCVRGAVLDCDSIRDGLELLSELSAAEPESRLGPLAERVDALVQPLKSTLRARVTEVVEEDSVKTAQSRGELFARFGTQFPSGCAVDLPASGDTLRLTDELLGALRARIVDHLSPLMLECLAAAKAGEAWDLERRARSLRDQVDPRSTVGAFAQWALADGMRLSASSPSDLAIAIGLCGEVLGDRVATDGLSYWVIARTLLTRNQLFVSRLERDMEFWEKAIRLGDPNQARNKLGDCNLDKNALSEGIDDLETLLADRAWEEPFEGLAIDERDVAWLKRAAEAVGTRYESLRKQTLRLAR